MSPKSRSLLSKLILASLCFFSGAGQAASQSNKVMGEVRFEGASKVERDSGVWIDGGRQWRLVDAYAGTAVEREIKALLARGGVVFGSSAGASIQASFLVRGAPATDGNPDGDNTIMIAPGYETGFGLLPNSAIDQHVEERARETDLDAVMATHPELLDYLADEFKKGNL